MTILDLVYDGSEASLSESICYNSRWDHVYWVDILQAKLYRYSLEDGNIKVYQMPSLIGCVIPLPIELYADKSSELVIVALQNEGICIYDLTHEMLVHVIAHPIEHDRVQMRYNDGKFGPDDAIWIGSMSIEEGDPCSRKPGNLYRINPKTGETTVKFPNVIIPNGMSWYDETMYFTDSAIGIVYRSTHGAIQGPIHWSPIITFDPKKGTPDGHCIDENGNLWIALWGGKKVICYDPVMQVIIDTIKIPAPHVTSCCIINGNRLFITTARVGLDEYKLDSYPLSGSVFSCQI